MRSISGAELLSQMRDAGGLVPGALVAERKGTADWVRGDLRYRITLKQADGAARWWVTVGDHQLGGSFQEGGILASVPIRPVPEQPAIAWPADDDEIVPFLRGLHARLANAVRFVADRRDLCGLLVSPTDVRRGDLVADLRTGYVERVLRALCIAQAAGDADSASVALAILQAPPAGGPADGPSSLLDQARIWADQWSYQSGRQIHVPDAIVAPRPTRAARPAADADGFWEHVG